MIKGCGGSRDTGSCSTSSNGDGCNPMFKVTDNVPLL